jgi:hypothetical protein
MARGGGSSIETRINVTIFFSGCFDWSLARIFGIEIKPFFQKIGLILENSGQDSSEISKLRFGV